MKQQVPLQEVSERMSQQWAPGKISPLGSLDQVVAELRLLSTELTMSVDILGKIRDSVHVLVLSLEEQL